MSVIFCDGFDHYRNPAYDWTNLLTKWDGAGGNGTHPFANIYVGKGRFGTNAAGIGSMFNNLQKTFPNGALDEFYLGAAICPSSLSHGQGIVAIANSIPLFNFRDFGGGTNVLGLAMGTTGIMYIGEGGGAPFASTTTLAVSTKPMRGGVYFYVEIGGKWSTHEVWVRLNEEQVMYTDQWGVAGTPGVTIPYAFSLGWNSDNWAEADFPMVFYDDLYLCDSLGGRNDSFLGDVRVEEHTPNNDGYWQQWFSSGAPVHYNQINEIPPDGDLTYVSSHTVGQKDTYTCASVTPTNGDIKAVCINYVATKTDSGLRKIRSLTRSPGGVDGLGTEIRIGANYVVYQSYMELNPVTGLPWTTDEVNTYQFGQELTG